MNYIVLGVWENISSALYEAVLLPKLSQVDLDRDTQFITDVIPYDWLHSLLVKNG
jgi:hypothetical protein